jgi:hypothetical protein
MVLPLIDFLLQKVFSLFRTFTARRGNRVEPNAIASPEKRPASVSAGQKTQADTANAAIGERKASYRAIVVTKSATEIGLLQGKPLPLDYVLHLGETKVLEFWTANFYLNL